MHSLNLTPEGLSGTKIGKALLAGKLVASVRGTDQHVTVKAVVKAKVNGRWANVTWDRATHVFLTVPAADGGWPDKIGTYYPQGKWEGTFFADRAADETRVKAALYVLRSAQGIVAGDHVVQGTHCYRCGKELTTPQSIDAGYGEDCADAIGAYHAGNTEHAPKVKGGDGTGTGTPDDTVPPVSIPNDFERSTQDVEQDKAKLNDARDGNEIVALLRKGDSAQQALAGLS